MVFEIIGSQYALTVDGRTVTYEQPLPKERVIDHIRIGISQSAANPFAIDDVKVYEALPKDGDEKGKKKKKRKKR